MHFLSEQIDFEFMFLIEIQNLNKTSSINHEDYLKKDTITIKYSCMFIYLIYTHLFP
jgi:hypothetical protein